jgi:hypothetical protein
MGLKVPATLKVEEPEKALQLSMRQVAKPSDVCFRQWQDVGICWDMDMAWEKYSNLKVIHVHIILKVRIPVVLGSAYTFFTQSSLTFSIAETSHHD